LKFTEEEEEALKEQNFFLLKHSATKKIVELFGKLEENLKPLAQAINPLVPDLNTTTGKIFRGENYRLFPYVVLDFPKLFSTQSIFAFRTMFWWGHEFSFTLHLQGEALDQFRTAIKTNIGMLRGKDVYYSIGETPWQYHFESDNYDPLDDLLMQGKELPQSHFLKLARRMEIGEYGNLVERGLETYRMFIRLLKQEA